MADLRPSVVVLEDDSTQEGVPLHRALEGDDPTGLNAQGALAFKDSSGNLVYPSLDASGRLPVTLDVTGQACLTDEGGVAGSTSFQTLATITLTNDAVYNKIGFLGSCFRDCVYEVVFIDDVNGTPTETILATFRTTAHGQTTFAEELECLEFTAGSTGDQELRIRGKQLQNASSDIDGMISAFEQQ